MTALTESTRHPAQHDHELLRDLHRSGTTVVVITHDQNLANGMPRQVRLLDGKIVADSVTLAALSEVAL